MSPSDLHPALASIRVRPLFVMRLAVKPIVRIGATPGVNRRVGIVTGGSFQGERLSGSVQDGGADWQDVHADGTTALDVRLILQTEDGALIGMRYTGVRAGPPEVLAKIDQGQAVDPAAYYLRTAARFETASEPYAWLNRIIAVGAGHREPGGPVYSLFEVL